MTVGIVLSIGALQFLKQTNSQSDRQVSQDTGDETTLTFMCGCVQETITEWEGLLA